MSTHPRESILYFPCTLRKDGHEDRKCYVSLDVRKIPTFVGIRVELNDLRKFSDNISVAMGVENDEGWEIVDSGGGVPFEILQMMARG
jgi:hypothetical protein